VGVLAEFTRKIGLNFVYYHEEIGQ
jgi:hypothetical protein